MICPRCGSHSILKNHDTYACLPCGHILAEPERQAWDSVSGVRGVGARIGPAWTEEESKAWREWKAGQETAKP